MASRLQGRKIGGCCCGDSGSGLELGTDAGLISQIDVGDAQVLGVQPTAAPLDHQHALPVPAAPPAVALASAAGASTKVAREDHTHAGVSSIDAGTGAFVTGSIAPTAIDIGDAQVTGTAGTAARADHQHALAAPAAPPAVAAASAAGTSSKVAREDHTHAGVTSVEALGGAVTISSPMKKVTGQDIRIDNGNSKTLGGAPVQADLDTEVNTDFIVAKLAAGATTIPKPKVPVNNFEARKITFTITSRGTSTDTVTFTTGADGYVWATQLGPLQADFDALVAAAPNNAVIEVGCKYSTALGKWMIVALAGYYA